MPTTFKFICPVCKTEISVSVLTTVKGHEVSAWCSRHVKVTLMTLETEGDSDEGP